MATSIFACGFECGRTGVHWTLGSNSSFVTTGHRSGARGLRINPTAATAQTANTVAFPAATRYVARFYITFTTLPSVDIAIAGLSDLSGPNVRFKQSDSKIYAGVGTTLGASGVAVTTGVTYRIECDFNISAGGNDTADVRVGVDNGTATACGQATAAGLAGTTTLWEWFDGVTSFTADLVIDDFMLSQTAADYPLGPGFVHAFIPTADGTHNVAGINDFERSATGTDITNSTTDAWVLIAKQPVDATTAAPSTYINLIAPPNATDYVENIYGAATGSSTPVAAPRAVEVLVGYAASATGTCNIRLALNDNGTTNDVFNGNPAVTNTNTRYTTKHYATAPTGGAWTVTSGAGNFNNLRIRCLTNDAAPDPFFACTMIEAEFAPLVPTTDQQMMAADRGIGLGIGRGMRF